MNKSSKKILHKNFMLNTLALRGGRPVAPKQLTKPSTVGKKEIAAATKVLKSGILSQAGRGEEVSKFEKSFAEYCKTRYAVTTTSGTTALHTALAAVGINSGDEVIVPALTFISSASVILQQNAIPIFADIDPRSFCLDTHDFERKITPKTKAVIIVHLYGNPANMYDVIRIAKERNIAVIEDCAQAHGTLFKKKRVGTFGDIGCFSFYQTKNMTCGEGGMVITNSKELYEACKSIADHGLVGGYLQGYNYDRLGYNYHLTELQAAIGRAQLAKLDRLNYQRQQNASLYRRLLVNTTLQFQEETLLGESTYYCVTALLPKHLISKRDRFINAVRAENVEVNNLYPLPLHKTNLFKKYSDIKLPVAENISARLFNLYTNPGITKQYIYLTCRAVQKVLSAL